MKTALDLLSVLICACLLQACALSPPDPPVVIGCVLPQDQSGTLSGHWPVTPIPIAFHQGDFSGSELSAMTAAADTWNKFFSASMGLSAVDYGGNSGNPRMSAQAKPNPVCSSSIVQGQTYKGQVVIYKDASWPYTSMTSAIALTSFCPSPGAPYPTFYMAITELNYQYFFVQGTKQPDLQSIVLHEFGHIGGLNHSCETFKKTGTPNCNDPSLPVDYFQAVMFPVFSFDSNGFGEIRELLGSNDEGRMNCLY